MNGEITVHCCGNTVSNVLRIEMFAIALLVQVNRLGIQERCSEISTLLWQCQAQVVSLFSVGELK